MTDDIVARLRRPAPDFGLEQYDPTYDDRQEAADKIERLLEEIQQLKHDSTIFINERSDAICENFDLREENAELRDEIERLRAALQEIFDHECRTSGRSFIACTARDALWPHAALEGEKTDV